MQRLSKYSLMKSEVRKREGENVDEGGNICRR